MYDPHTTRCAVSAETEGTPCVCRWEWEGGALGTQLFITHEGEELIVAKAAESRKNPVSHFNTKEGIITSVGLEFDRADLLEFVRKAPEGAVINVKSLKLAVEGPAANEYEFTLSYNARELAV